MIYFVQRADRLIKIGTTRCLETRVSQLQTAFGGPVRILAVIDGSFAKEREIHERFAHLRGKGELFRAEADLLAFIESVAGPWRAEVREVAEAFAEAAVAGRAIAIRPHVTRVAAIVREKTSRPFPAQKLSKMLNSVRVSRRDLEQLAAGIGVTVADLVRP